MSSGRSLPFARRLLLYVGVLEQLGRARKFHTKPIDQSTLAVGLTIAQFEFIGMVGIHVKGHWLLAYTSTSLYPIVPSASSL